MKQIQKIFREKTKHKIEEANKLFDKISKELAGEYKGKIVAWARIWFSIKELEKELRASFRKIIILFRQPHATPTQ